VSARRGKGERGTRGCKKRERDRSGGMRGCRKGEIHASGGTYERGKGDAWDMRVREAGQERDSAGGANAGEGPRQEWASRLVCLSDRSPRGLDLSWHIRTSLHGPVCVVTGL
jgi:hypothetical protein